MQLSANAERKKPLRLIEKRFLAEQRHATMSISLHGAPGSGSRGGEHVQLLTTTRRDKPLLATISFAPRGAPGLR